MQDHADAGDLLRFTVFALTFVLVGLLFAKPPALRIVLRVLHRPDRAGGDLLHDPHRAISGRSSRGVLTRNVDKVNGNR